jgi:integrase
MASKNRKGRAWSIQFYDNNKQRKTISLGRCTEATAVSVRQHVENLELTEKIGDPIPPETRKWVAGLKDNLHAKLAKFGLVKPRFSVDLEPYIQSYIDSHGPEKKEGTLKKWRTGQTYLIEFLGGGTRLSDVSGTDATDFDRWLTLPKPDGKGQQKPTAAKYIAFARQVFNHAVDTKLLEENPFSGVKTTKNPHKSRQHYIDVATANKVLDKCPDIQWKLVFALARFGCFRCPSEHMKLRWEDVLWDEQKIVVHSPKTEHHEGGESRVIPLFPELLPLLEQAFDSLPERSSEWVITIGRTTKSPNFRTTMEKIIKRAGIKPWPKLFQNLRSSCETDFVTVKGRAEHVAAEWASNSVKVARKHYLQVTDDDFKKATATSGSELNQEQL